MKRFSYRETEREVGAAQAAVHAAAREARKHPNKNTAATEQWKDEAARFHRTLSRAYPQNLLDALEALKRNESADIGPVLDFLEADPVFYGSGYVKEEALRLLPRVPFSDEHKARLRAILIRAVETNGRREFKRYALIGRHICSEELRSSLERLLDSSETAVARRAQWALNQLPSHD